MSIEALKKITVEDAVLSSGVALGVWSTPSGSTLPSFDINNEQNLKAIKERKASVHNFFNKLDKPLKRLCDQNVPAELLHERLD
ncbi:MAG: hypothetical protein ACXWQQ_02105 [Pseudobdellovibrio sp.]